MFDPAIGPDPDIRRHRIADADFESSAPIFVDLHGRRQSVRKWGQALRFGLVVAERVVNDLSLLERVSGCRFSCGRREGGVHIRELNATLTHIPSGSSAEALRNIILNLHLPCRIRIERHVGGLREEAVFQNTPAPHLVPTFGRPLPFVPGVAPGLLAQHATSQMDDRILKSLSCAETGEILPGSIVRLLIPGVVDGKILRIVEGEGRPAQGSIGRNTPIAQAIIGEKAGETVLYRSGPHVRKIFILEVDNTTLCQRLRAALPETKRPDPEMEPSF